MARGNLKVILIHNIISPHVVPQFQKLAQRPGLELKVYFLSETEENRRWRIKPAYGFAYQVLPKITLTLRHQDLFSYHINPTVILHLLRDAPDVVVSAGWDSLAAQSSFLFCKVRHLPFVLWSGSTINEPSWRRDVSLPLVKFIVRHSDAYIAYGTRAKEYLIHLGAPAERIFISINTVDTEYFQSNSMMSEVEKAALTERLGIQTTKTILYVGQLIERKGVTHLLRAYALLKREYSDVSLLIVGYGYQEGELKDICEREQIEDVVFLGHIDVSEVPRFYGLADLFVLPSSEEVWGLVINEALACGLPVITTNKVGASVDLVKEGKNGYIVEAGNVVQLYQSMKRVITDTALAKAMGVVSRQLSEKFTIDSTVDGLISAIRYAANTRRRDRQ
ncbi:MAG: glycosyltransferase family 4 protein [Chloroflexi bacterium]|nr:glycosyltransferase family 4 protein [Chloroflexota bacterium]MCL5075294.1 glycosyltransferase family 4 protein [Chloroflexota bacterium]